MNKIDIKQLITVLVALAGVFLAAFVPEFADEFEIIAPAIVVLALAVIAGDGIGALIEFALDTRIRAVITKHVESTETEYDDALVEGVYRLLEVFEKSLDPTEDEPGEDEDTTTIAGTDEDATTTLTVEGLRG